MDRKQTKQQALELLSAGTPKNQIFESLRGGALKDKALASVLANHPDPQRYRQHRLKVMGVVAIMVIQGLLAGWVGFVLGESIGPTAIWLMPLALAALPFLFAYGIYQNRPGFYTAYLLLSLSQSHKLFDGLTEDPTTTVIGVLVAFGILVYVMYVKSLLFPDVLFMSPKKIKGQYVFTD